MRIAVLTTSWPRAGGDAAGHFVRAEALALARGVSGVGARVTVFAPDAPREPELEVLSLTGGSAFGWPGVLPRLRESPLRAVAAVSWLSQARAALAARSFDRVIAHWAVPCAFPIARGAVEVVSHGSDVDLLARAHFVVDDIAARAVSWRFVSAGLLERLLRALPSALAARVLRVARVEPCAFEMPPPARVKGFEDGFVCAIGRLIPQKRVDRVLEVAAREDAPLVVVGDGPERARLERLARGTRARFVGHLPRAEALGWLAASRALWFASAREGAPTVLREAEALGVPIRFL